MNEDNLVNQSMSRTVSSYERNRNYDNGISTGNTSNYSIINHIIDGKDVDKVDGWPYLKRPIRNCEVDSEMGKRVIDSNTPLVVNETRTITVRNRFGKEYTGIYLNINEIDSWRGEKHIDQYQFNLDESNFDTIKKENLTTVTKQREVRIHYLRPKRPAPPGAIYIIQQADRQAAPAPPLVIRVEKPGQKGQDEVVYEQPPTPPPAIKPKVIVITGKKIEPPKRRLIFESVPQPGELGKLEIYRWLQYEPQKREVIYHKEFDDTPVCPDPRNLIINWSAPKVVEQVNVRYDTVAEETDVEEWVRAHQAAGHRLVPTEQLEQRIKDFNGSQFEADLVANKKYVETLDLSGAVDKFSLVNLAADSNRDIREYRQWLEARGIRYDGVSINMNVDTWSYEFIRQVESFYARTGRHLTGNELDRLFKQMFTNRNFNDRILPASPFEQQTSPIPADTFLEVQY